MKKRIDVAIGLVLRQESVPDGEKCSLPEAEQSHSNRHLWKILITRRPPETVYGGYWEFPGGKLEPGEGPEQAVVRELAEELNIKVAVDRPLKVVVHDYPHALVRLHPFCCTQTGGDVQNLGVSAHRWVGMETLQGYVFPEANQLIIKQLIEIMKYGTS